MQFLYPGVLWLLGLIAVPVIIHLFNFRRVKKVYFSNISFLQQVRKETNRQSQLKRWLILLSRILFVTFLVIAFAQPISTDLESKPQTFRKIYLDNSLSMSRLGQGGMTLLDEGVLMIEELVVSGEAGMQYILSHNDFERISSRFLVTKEVQEKLTEVDYSRRFRQLNDVVNRMNGERPVPGTDFFIISDFQKSSSENLSEIFEDSLTRYHLIKIANKDEGNLFVDSVYLESAIGLSNTNNLNIVLQNAGSEDRTNVLVKVFRDSVQFSTFTVDISANSVETTTINIGGHSQLSGGYLVEIEDNVQVFDNKYYFSIDKPKKTSVSLVSENQPSKYLTAAFSNPEIFTLSQFPISAIDYEAIRQSDFIILSGLGRVPDWLEQSMVENATLLVIPGNAIDINSYENLLQMEINKATDTATISISRESLSSPFFEGVFASVKEQISLPWVKSPYHLQGFHTVILNTNLKRPFIIRSGQSRVFFFTAPLTDAYTDFHKHSLFIPVLYKLSQSSSAARRLAYSFDDQLIALEGLELPESAIPRIGNGNQSFVPGVIRTNDEVLLDIPKEIVDPGIYTLSVEADTITRLAFNYNKAESEDETLGLAELRQLVSGFDNVQIYDVSDVDDFKRSLGEINEGTGLWKYALLLALVFIVTEMLLLRFTK